jgi:LacI family transcriptional regulator
MHKELALPMEDHDGKGGTAGHDSATTDSDERPTLKTIARLAGLAVPTISRALNDAPDIGDDTKRKVREIATRIGYRPNRAGVRLRTGKTNVISLVLSTEHDMMNHTARLISTLSGALRGTPYHLIITPYFPSEDPMDPVRYIVETGSADGIIMNQTEPRDARAAYLLERDFPFATHGRTLWNHPWADFDNGAFGRIAVQRLLAKGRRRIALLRPPHTQSYSIHMYEGVMSACAAAGIRPLVIEGLTSDSPVKVLEQEMPRYLRGPDAVQGLVIGSTNAVMATVSAAEDMGLEIGRDIDIAAKEAIPFLSRFRREILTMQEDVSLAGNFLARAIMHRIANPGAAPMQFLDVPQFPAGVGNPQNQG